MRTTLKDIAQATGLSVTSISLVLNARPNRLSEESRRKVLEAAKQLNYSTSSHSSPSASECHSIGLIVPNISDFFFGEIAQGVIDCARTHDFTVLLGTNGESPQMDNQNIRSLSRQGVRALLIVSAHEQANTLLDQLSFPVIQVDRQSLSLNRSAVLLNHRKGGYLATRHLIDLGHRHIACITGPGAQASSQQRLAGYRWAFEETGLPLPKNAIFEGDYAPKSGYQLLDSIISAGFTAVFCGNDMMAIGIYKRMRELGLKPAQDLSIVGFDDISFADLLEVPLTTIRQSGYNIGFEACKRAFLELDNPDLPKQTIQFEPELVIRQSTRKKEE
ncbi:LacI family DNA-binding transcriptional regulator [uncultured Pseudoflavonifractor sp.]|uniref:LacI family DNA-binding transcriptional regulator n=1 Tax=uncultured Pseudoflavonifractor sp. TaxID=1221379 RepID=UPI0025EBECA2|nr:LacI family DNA-binding transcriptional regulator [uncultured Pseudoflavonifractor sp.]